MPGRLGPRFALEAGFLIVLAVAMGLAELSATAIVVVMAVAWLLVALVEWLASRGAAPIPQHPWSAPRAEVWREPEAVTQLVHDPVTRAEPIPLPTDGEAPAAERAEEPSPVEDVAAASLEGEPTEEPAAPEQAALGVDGDDRPPGDPVADAPAGGQPRRRWWRRDRGDE